MPLFTDDMVVQVENPLASTKKLPELVSECNDCSIHDEHTKINCISTCSHWIIENWNKSYCVLENMKYFKDKFDERCTRSVYWKL